MTKWPPSGPAKSLVMRKLSNYLQLTTHTAPLSRSHFEKLQKTLWWPCLWNSEIYQEISPFRVLWKVFVSEGFTDFRVTHLKLEGTSLIQVTKGECWDLGTTSTASCSNSHAVIVENITTLPSNSQWGEAILNGWKVWILEYKKKYSFMIFKH